MDALLLARMQFAANISFHILFPTISIAMGWVLLYFKWRFRRSGDDVILDAFRFVQTATVTGTVAIDVTKRTTSTSLYCASCSAMTWVSRLAALPVCAARAIWVMPSTGGNRVLNLRGLQVEIEAPGRLRYQGLLMQASGRSAVFQGRKAVL